MAMGDLFPERTAVGFDFCQVSAVKTYTRINVSSYRFRPPLNVKGVIRAPCFNDFKHFLLLSFVGDGGGLYAAFKLRRDVF